MSGLPAPVAFFILTAVCVFAWLRAVGVYRHHLRTVSYARKLGQERVYPHRRWLAWKVLISAGAVIISMVTYNTLVFDGVWRGLIASLAEIGVLYVLYRLWRRGRSR